MQVVWLKIIFMNILSGGIFGEFLGILEKF
jgi:hypothetical protein